ncbi:MAG: dolichyl-phosphate beta-glucosyltransferase [Acidobacteriota bacterium]
MPDSPALSIVIPAYNEAARLPGTLERIARYLAAAPHRPVEILVVDDGSRDATVEAARQVAMPAGVELLVLSLGTNQGKGAAVRSGLRASRGRQVLISDADLATPIEEVEKLLACPAEIAVGSRGVQRELIVRRQPLPRSLLGRLFNLGLRTLGLTSLSDTQCGFKLLDGELARRLAGQLRLDGFAFDVELLARARRAGARIAEVPVRWYHMEDSRVHALRHGLQMLRDALRIRWWLWLGK